jgi:hypothetical protein
MYRPSSPNNLTAHLCNGNKAGVEHFENAMEHLSQAMSALGLFYSTLNAASNGEVP